MRRATASAAMGVAALVVAACGGCNSRSTPQAAPAASSVEPVAVAPPPPKPVDHLAPDELIEGPEQAFGVALPRGVVVTDRFDKVVWAEGPARMHPLVEYYRARLRGGTITEGAASVTIEHAGVPGKPGTELRIHAEAATGGVRIEVRDVTLPPGPEGLDEDERWRAVGLTRDGKIADPSHFE